MPARPRPPVPLAARARRAGLALPGHSPNRPALARMLEIHQVLCQGARPGQRLNCATLAARLGFSAKTVHRDLTYMRDPLGLPVDYDAQEKS